MQNISVDWSQFENQSKNPTSDFEKLARLLFHDFYCADGVTLHSNPSNPGVEVLPVLGKSGKTISFQAKYYINSINYSDIKASFKKAVCYFGAALDTVYLYCNKDITTTSQSYKSCEKVLSDSGIALIPVTGQEILNQVIKRPYIKEYFFGGHTFDAKWFMKITELSRKGLGKRYNNNFNIITETEKALELFCGTNAATERINQRKKDTIAFCKAHAFGICSGQVKSSISVIKELEDVAPDTLCRCLEWCIPLKPIVDELEQKYYEIEQRIQELGPSKDYNKEKHNLYNERNELFRTNLQLKHLFFTEEESSLINSQILFLYGEAGSGKSHCLCDLAVKLSTTANGVLILGTHFFTEACAESQLLEILGLSNSSLEEILQSFQCLSMLSHRPVIIFFDAINEAASKKIWLPLINKLRLILKNYPMVKVVFSYRTGYKQMIFSDQYKEIMADPMVSWCEHKGFSENSIEATKRFFNFYRITFSPQYYFYNEFQNPLFLQMYCETYDGATANVDITKIFRKFISQADIEVKRNLTLDDISENIVFQFLQSIAEYMLTNKAYSISARTVKSLPFWIIAGLENKKLQFISAVTRTNLLISAPKGDEEVYYIGFNLLHDYILAESVVKMNPDAEELSLYVREQLLEVDNGSIKNNFAVDIYVIVCALTRRINGSENIREILDVLSDSHREYLLEQYVKAFEWREIDKDTANDLLDLIHKYGINEHLFLDIVIANSLKPASALNAFYLHKMLLKPTVVDRDSFWSIYIGERDTDGFRLFELIEVLEHHEEIIITDENVKLIIVFLSWVLTSSNRYLRDHCSKAIIVVLTSHFNLCKWLLDTFIHVNDPYVMQRLYGCIYGAVLRNTQHSQEEFFQLADFVYKHIFLAEEVYPDILLRDYASGIIARYVYEYPEAEKKFHPDKYLPPYGTKDLPVMEDTTEEYDNYISGAGYIIRSMKPDRIPEPGGYGDFGRYIFQSAISYFEDADVKNAYLYAMYYIFHKLNYKNELLGEHDRLNGYYQYSRHSKGKNERIGKKYEWIAFHNTLAHIADNYNLTGEGPYKGAWKLYIRDFDPTLFHYMLHDPNAENLLIQEHLSPRFIEDFDAPDKDIVYWANTDSTILDVDNNPLVCKDYNGNEWVVLCQTQTYDYKDPVNYDGVLSKRQHVWRYSFAYFIKAKDFDGLLANLQGANFQGRWFPEGMSTTTVFNREYYWSPAYKDTIGSEWIRYEPETGEVEEVVHENDNLLQIYDDFKNEVFQLPQKWTQVIKKKQYLCDILPAYLDYSWEGEFDSSQDETSLFSVPCTELVTELKLEQKKYDGYFYHNDELVAFDSRLNNTGDSLLIRKDYLLNFLENKGYRMFWTILGEKQFMKGHNCQIWSEWSGLAYINANHVIVGNIWKAKEAVLPKKQAKKVIK